MSQIRKKHPFYSEVFKEHVIERVLNSEMSVLEASRHYGIHGKMTIYHWLKKKKISNGESIEKGRPLMSKKDKRAIDKLADEVKSLKQKLESEQLRSEAYETMVKLAEEKYGIPIEKKSGAKRSKK